MRRFMFAASIGLCLIAGTVVMVFGSSAQEPIETLTLLQQRLEGLPEGAICWDVRRGSLAQGMSSPANGNHVHGLVVSYVFDGFEDFAYEDGRSDTVGPGQAALFEADTPHRHDSVGTVPRTNVGFEMTCEPQPNSIGNTGDLPVRSGGIQHEIQVRERIWQPGARTPVHVLSGPTATLVLEGTIQSGSARPVPRPVQCRDNALL